MELTAEAFMQTLDRPGLEQVSAGIVLQAYMPDSFRDATANQRVGAPRAWRPAGRRSRVRLVEGRQHGDGAVGGVAPRLAAGALPDEARNGRQLQAHAAARRCSPRTWRRCGWASPRTTCSIWPTAWCWPRERTRCDKVQFEMLEGMANHQRRALFELTPQRAALRAGLPQGELPQRHRLPDPPPGREHGPGELPAPRLQAAASAAPDWQRLEQRLPRCVRRHRHRLATRRGARRTGSRPPRAPPPGDARGWQQFVNEPDTDFSLPHNGAWARADHRRWEPRCGDRGAEIPLVDRRRSDHSTAEPCASAWIRRGPASSWAATARPTDEDIDARRRLRRRRIRTAGGRCRVARALSSCWAGWPRNSAARGRPAGRRPGRRRQDAGRIRPRGLRGGGLRASSTATRPRWCQRAARRPGDRQGRGRRRLAVEFPDRDSLRRRRGGAGGRQHRDPQARLGHGAGGLGAVPSASGAPACRRQALQFVPCSGGQAGRGWSAHPRRRTP